MTDLLCVSGGDRGKFHVSATDSGEVIETACGLTLHPQQGVVYRYLDLIDGRDRCKAKGCIDARITHKGLA